MSSSLSTVVPANSIKTRLGAAGWDIDLFNYVPSRWHLLVEKPEPLTDVEWPELLPELERLLEAARKARYRHHLVGALHLRYRSRVHNMTPEKQEIMFEWNTIVSMSYFQDIIMGPADFTPVTFALLEEMYRKLYDHMISNHEAFKACLVKKLRNPTINCPLRPDELDYHFAYEDDALLDLATSLLTWNFEPDPLYSLNSYKQALSTMVFFEPCWDDDALSYSASTLLAARRVLKELGFPTDALMSEVVEALRTGVACICTHDTQAYWDCDLGYANLVFHVSKFHMTNTELFLLRL
ncbi:hypothetical protein ONZ45_g10920 [Pleurotus djamor]|nr:hypothetical protein ONZ45_g10920 [Pleurotus djamor]